MGREYQRRIDQCHRLDQPSQRVDGLRLGRRSGLFRFLVSISIIPTPNSNVEEEAYPSPDNTAAIAYSTRTGLLPLAP